MRAHRLLLAVAAALSLGASCGPGVPGPDACSDSKRGQIDAIELGAGGDGPFRPLAEGEVIAPTRGPQGGEMIGVRLRVIGAEPPRCLTHQTWAEDGEGSPFADLTVPVKTYTDGYDARATRTMLLIIHGETPAAGSAFTVHAMVGDLAISRALEMGY